MKTPFIYLFSCLFMFDSDRSKENPFHLDQIWDGTFRTQGMTALHSMNNGQQYSVLNFDRSARIDFHRFIRLQNLIQSKNHCKLTIDGCNSILHKLYV